jgi:hypothetical protein
MLKRKDLSKDFELIVKQEIKNHNDSVLNTNISLERLRSELYDLKKSIDKEAAIRDSQFTSLRINATISDGNHRDSLYNKFENLNNIIKIYTKKFDELFNEFKILKNELSKNNEIDRLHNELINIKEDHKKNILDLKNNIEFRINNAELKNKVCLNNVVADFKMTPSHIEHVKNDILKKINEFKIDNVSLVSEVKHFRKENFIMTKKIENLYTLNDRLKLKIEQG